VPEQPEDVVCGVDQMPFTSNLLKASIVELQRLGEALVTDRPEVQHLAALAEPAVLGGERRALISGTGMHPALSPEEATSRYGCSSPPRRLCFERLH
jgi:hypothetical protein